MLWDVTSAHLIANAQQTLCNTPEERTPQVNIDGSPKPAESKLTKDGIAEYSI
jgi:hypothetical protein